MGALEGVVRAGDSFSYFMYRSEIRAAIQPFSHCLCRIDVERGIGAALHERDRCMSATHEISRRARPAVDARARRG